MKVQLRINYVPVSYWDDANRFHETTYWWHIIAGNGQVVATSETYSSKSAAKKMAKKIAKMMNVPFVVMETNG